MLINDLNSKFEISYLGFVENSSLLSHFYDRQLFVSPTKGENFGYAIAESLSVSVPVLISTNTPFKNIKHLKFGFDCNLENENLFLDSLLFFLSLDNFSYNNYREVLSNNYRNYYNLETIKSSYINLFTK